MLLAVRGACILQPAVRMVNTDGFDRAATLCNPTKVMGTKDWQEAIILSLVYVGVVCNAARLARLARCREHLAEDRFKGLKWFQQRMRAAASLKDIMEDMALSVLKCRGKSSVNEGSFPARSPEPRAEDTDVARNRMELFSAALAELSTRKQTRSS